MHWTIRGILGMSLLGMTLAASAQASIKAPDNRALWGDFWNSDARLVPAQAYPFIEIFEQASTRYDVPLPLLLAVARGESMFNPRAENSVPCIGVMQIRWPITAKHLGIHRKSDLYDPETNIMAGGRYLREMLNLHGNNVYLALAAYHHGPGNIYKGIPQERIPPKANWYTGYIRHHFSKLRFTEDGEGSLPATETTLALNAAQLTGGHVELVAFNMKFRVEGYIQTIEKRVPGLKLEYFKQHRAGEWRYDIVLVYENAADLQGMVERYIEVYRATPIDAVKRLFDLGRQPEDIRGLNSRTAREIQKGHL
jgi:hypothetical protein